MHRKKVVDLPVILKHGLNRVRGCILWSRIFVNASDWSGSLPVECFLHDFSKFFLVCSYVCPIMQIVALHVARLFGGVPPLQTTVAFGGALSWVTLESRDQKPSTEDSRLEMIDMLIERPKPWIEHNVRLLSYLLAGFLLFLLLIWLIWLTDKVKRPF